MCHPLFARGLGRYGLECTCSSRGEKRRQGPKHCTDTSFRSRFTLIGRRPCGCRHHMTPSTYDWTLPIAVIELTFTSPRQRCWPSENRCLKFLAEAKSFNWSHSFLSLAVLPAANKRAICPMTQTLLCSCIYFCFAFQYTSCWGESQSLQDRKCLYLMRLVHSIKVQHTCNAANAGGIFL